MLWVLSRAWGRRTERGTAGHGRPFTRSPSVRPKCPPVLVYGDGVALLRDNSPRQRLSLGLAQPQRGGSTELLSHSWSRKASLECLAKSRDRKK